MMEGPGADSEEKHEPVSDIDTVVVVVGLKALDPEWPIREVVVVGLKALDPEWPIREAIGRIADIPQTSSIGRVWTHMRH